MLEIELKSSQDIYHKINLGKKDVIVCQKIFFHKICYFLSHTDGPIKRHHPFSNIKIPRLSEGFNISRRVLLRPTIQF